MAHCFEKSFIFSVKNMEVFLKIGRNFASYLFLLVITGSFTLRNVDKRDGYILPDVTELFVAKSLSTKATQVSTSIRSKRPVMAKENNHLQSLQFLRLTRKFDRKFVKKYISINGWFEPFRRILKETSGAHGTQGKQWVLFPRDP